MHDEKSRTPADEQQIDRPVLGEDADKDKIARMNALYALAKMAATTKDHFDQEIAKGMTATRADRIYQLRCVDGHSWRSLASNMFNEWPDAPWSPPSNQLAGMALCEQAADMRGEDPAIDPWN